MKVIDLLNRIANGEEVPEKIKFEYLEYELLPERNDYYCSEHMRWFTNEINALGVLNDEVEIIKEDKKIENNFKYVYGCNNIKINANFENIKTTLENIIKVIDEMRKDK